MQVLPAKRQNGNCTERYSKGLRNQHGEHLVNLCESNNPWNTGHVPNSELARTLLPVENTKIT